MSSSSNIGYIAQQQPAVSAGQSFVPFWIYGEATCDGTAGDFPLLDDAGDQVIMPRAGKCIGYHFCKTTHAGNSTVQVSKDGTAIGAGCATTAIGVPSAAVHGALFATATDAEMSFASGVAVGATFSASAVDGAKIYLCFMPE